MTIPYEIWGVEDIEKGAITQMENACELPIARKAALMPDAHQGYGVPIGGVLATKDAVVPFAVGVDIACRMRLTITDADKTALNTLNFNDAKACATLYDEPLQKGTKFGMGCEYTRSGRLSHPVMDHGDWRATDLLHEMKGKAWRQLGTSGSGNHFVEWGFVVLNEKVNGVKPGCYVALLSHSGSRNAGHKVCTKYTRIAKKVNPAGELSWLDLDSEEGQEYWLSMELMGQYAAANHHCIHQQVLQRSGLKAIGHVENHHNFAWKEVHDGEEVIVHRKGATPAALGELGVIPGSMATPAFIVRGKGNEASLKSASHGAGRAMSRKAAKKQFDWKEWRPILEEKGVRLLGAGLDEVPGAYKNIHAVMDAQKDLVEIVGEFHPCIVMMDGSHPED